MTSYMQHIHARPFVVLLLGMTIMSLPYCAGSSDTTTTDTQTESSIDAERMGAIGARIHQSPDNSEAILAEEGMTRSEFESNIRMISEDPALSKVYRHSFERHMGDRKVY
jgi:hypothetical protein